MQVLSNRGYDGEMVDIWSCGVILYVILTGFLPFDDRNLAVLYQKVICVKIMYKLVDNQNHFSVLHRMFDKTNLNVFFITIHKHVF